MNTVGSSFLGTLIYVSNDIPTLQYLPMDTGHHVLDHILITELRSLGYLFASIAGARSSKITNGSHQLRLK